MTTKAIKATAPTLSPIDAALAQLAKAGALEAKAGAAISKAKESATNAQALAIAAMTTPGVLSLTFDYDVLDRKGDIVEHVKGAKLIDYAKGFTSEGKEYRAKATAFRQSVLPRFFNIPGDNDSVWSMFRQTFPAALALIGEGMTATVGADGKLALVGGAGDSAKKLRDAAAKSVTALKTAAKGETAKRKPSLPGDKAPASNEPRAATLTDLLTLVRDFLHQSVVADGTPEYAAMTIDDKLIADIAVLAKSYGELPDA